MTAVMNLIVCGRFKPFALRTGNLITGQQQFTGSTAAALVVEALDRVSAIWFASTPASPAS